MSHLGPGYFQEIILLDSEDDVILWGNVLIVGSQFCDTLLLRDGSSALT